ncbi:MAG: hypothetical protein Q8R02_06925 [Hyphomonadaceae bacterium]|nr:hypothetical protein [Hyphomonadaceae bacterium]
MSIGAIAAEIAASRATLAMKRGCLGQPGSRPTAHRTSASSFGE